MSLFYKVADNLGHIILNYLDCEDFYSIHCTNYTSHILKHTKLYNTLYPLETYWKDLCKCELYDQSVRKYDEDYQKYLNSDAFLQEYKTYI